MERYLALRLATHASALAFFLLLSLVPLLAFLFLILKVFQITDLVRPYLLRIVTGGNLALVDEISRYIENAQAGGLGGLGLTTLFVVGFIVLQRVKTTLNLIWQVERRPSYRYRFVEYLAILAVSPFLLMATFSLTTFLEGAGQVEALSAWEAFGLSGIALTKLSGYLVMWLLVFYAYTFVPDTRVYWWDALVGALLAGSLLRLVESAYLDTLFRVADYNMVYGAMALLPFMMIWFYLAWTVFLLGSLVSFILQNYEMAVERYRSAGHFVPDTPFAIVVVLATVMRTMEEKSSAPHLREIRKRSGLPRGVVVDAIRRLEAAQLLTPVMDQPGRVVPQEALGNKTVREILARVEMLPVFSKPPVEWTANTGTTLEELFANANKGMSKRLDGKTLAEMAESLPDAP